MKPWKTALVLSGLWLQMTLASGQNCQFYIDTLTKINKSVNYAQLLPVLDKADPVCLAEVGPDHYWIGTLLIFRASGLVATGKYAAALEYLQKAEPIILKTKGWLSDDYASLKNSKADVLFYLGRYPEALTNADSSIEITLKTVGKDTLIYGNRLSSKAAILLNSKAYKEALPLAMEALQNAEKYVGVQSPNYLARMTVLCGVLYKLGMYDELLKQALAGYSSAQKVWGEAHFGTISLRLFILTAYTQLGRFKEAEALGVDLLPFTEQALGEAHPFTQAVRSNLATAKMNLGNLSGAVIIYQKALDLDKKQPGLSVDGRCTIQGNLATAHAYMGNPHLAYPIFLQDVTCFETSIGKQTPDFVRSRRSLANCLMLMGNKEAAEEAAVINFSLGKNVLGADHPEMTDLILASAVIFASNGNLNKADTMLREAIPDITAKLGPKHSQVALAKKYLSVNLWQQSRYKEALALFNETLPLLKNSVGVANYNYIQALQIRARCLRDLKKSKRAERQFREALFKTDTFFGKNYPLRANIAADYALLLENRRGKHVKAQTLFLDAGQNLRNQIDHNFTVLSETGQDAFLADLEPNFNVFRSFVQRQNHHAPELAAAFYDDELQLKGATLQSARAILAILHAAGDSTLIRQFETWRDQKEVISYQLSLSPEKRLFSPVELDSIARAADLTETLLVQNSADFRDVRAQISWQNVRDSLKTREAAIEFTRFRYFDGHRATDSVFYAALVLRPGDRDPIYVPLFEEKQLADHLREAAEATNIKEYIGIAYHGDTETKLYQLIWKPLEPLLTGAKTVFYAPSGLLHRISLPLISVVTGKQLLQRYDMHLVASTREIALRGKNLPGNKIQTVLLCGGIAYDADSLCLEKAISPQDSLKKAHLEPLALLPVSRGGCETGQILPLPGTKTETDKLDLKLKSRAFVRLLQGCTAREEAIKTLGNGAPSPDVVHIATHGFFCDAPEGNSSNMPLFRSGLLLAGAQRIRSGMTPYKNMDDGILYAYEAAQLNLTGTKLVVLSACETALGDIRGSEGVYGLARAFRLAGAEHVMMSLWQISDQQTVHFMEVFYENWLGGQDIQDAFLNTQRALQQEGTGEEVWGAFVLL